MSISGLDLHLSLYRNLSVGKTEETTDEKKIKQLKTAAEQLGAQQTVSTQRERIGNVKKTDDFVAGKSLEQSATLNVSYGVGQNTPQHTVPKTAPQDFTFDLKKDNDFHLVAARNKIEDIDVEKEMNNMKRETVLDQYKYFVNPAKLGSDQDGSVKIVQWD